MQQGYIVTKDQAEHIKRAARQLQIMFGTLILMFEEEEEKKPVIELRGVRKAKRPMSASARHKISLAQKRRWRATRKGN